MYPAFEMTLHRKYFHYFLVFYGRPVFSSVTVSYLPLEGCGKDDERF
jgi:hypothetical protein